MNWIIKINNNPKYRVVVDYLPFENKIIFNGEYVAHKKSSVEKFQTFVRVERVIDNISSDDIQDILIDLYNELKRKTEKYNTFNKIMNETRSVEFIDD